MYRIIIDSIWIINVIENIRYPITKTKTLVNLSNQQRIFMIIFLNRSFTYSIFVIYYEVIMRIPTSGGSFMNESFQWNDSSGGTNRNDSTYSFFLGAIGPKPSCS